MSTEENGDLVSPDEVGDSVSKDQVETSGEENTPESSGVTSSGVTLDNEFNEQAEDGLGEPVEAKPCRSLHWKIEFILLSLMLVIALVGMAVTQASLNGAWEYWIFAVVVFAGIGTFRDVKWARESHESVWKAVCKQLIHWSVLLLVMKALFWMERYNSITREAASFAAILLLALTSIHAGIHFHWTFAIVGVVLAVISVVLGVLQQSMLLAWLIVVPLVLIGAFVFFLRAKLSANHE